MMKNSLVSSLRNETGSNASHRSRDLGNVPAVIYGKSINTLTVEIERTEVEAFVRNQGGKGLVQVNVGGQPYTTFVKEMQRDPVTGMIMHVDFQQVNQDEQIHTMVPIILKGRGFVEKGGVTVQQQVRELEVQCFAGSIPEKFEFDISNFRPGDTLKVSDVEFGEEVSIINNLESVIASIATPAKIIDDEGEVPLEKKIELADME
ncbi:ribosomal 5S rRNA E-loop binding protein Ctc/L25/TL5 [Alkaliphilus metalliredigens QYMF]|uniref:Large ribosomal subunit protein bL25 n=1 Tax=Alkaliphilus metalliredigens (strain QYMF) TaxID=293826 RepID=A6TJB3_ALKMQ|nr:50S ribosomal protein L25 [Alkaliphilus metalliredigens]ABR46281.1 ribosomal 5S rRNA E-loop binding protein Ctc/L25/TL5 [Alkaliphilus metalliredigens QYMF]